MMFRYFFLFVLLLSANAFAANKYQAHCQSCEWRFTLSQACGDATTASNAAGFSGSWSPGPGLGCTWGGANGGFIGANKIATTEACPDGYTEDSSGDCQPPASPCPPNQQRNAAGQCECIKVQPGTLLCVANCQALKGSSFMTTAGHAATGQNQGCSTNCAAAIGSSYYMQCTYLGTDAEGGNGTGNEGEGEGENGGGESGGELPEGTVEAPPDDEEGNPQPCPPGTEEGEVNGTRYCAPNGLDPEAPTNPTETDPTGLGVKLEQIRQSVEGTKAAVESTGNAVIRQTSVLENGLARVEAAINAQGPNVGGGGDGGTGEGAGDCDPTAENYFECAGLLEEVGDDQAANILQTQNDATDQLLSDHEQSALELQTDIADDESIPGPSALSSLVQAVIPQPTACVQMTLDFPGHPLILPCDKFDFLKQLIGWALAMYTIYLIFGMATRPSGA